jgi:upstream stimulatory factor
MDMFEHDLDRPDKCEDSNDDVQLTMEDGPEGHSSVGGVVTSLTLDANGQYQFRTDNGQGSVTYRVVQVTPGEDGQPHLVAGLSSNQAMLHNSLSNGDGSAGSLLQTSEGRLTYIPAVASGSTDSVHGGLDGTVGTQINTASGPFYVMMAPQDIVQAASGGVQRTLVPRSGLVAKLEPGLRVTRDDRRRATHNEVERRRRDKINGWIQQLAHLVPECNAEERRQNELRNLLPGSAIEINRNTSEESQKSKGGILQKACDYIRELQSTNAKMSERVKLSDDLMTELDTLRQQCEELRQENEILRELLQQHGIELPTLAPTDDPDIV